MKKLVSVFVCQALLVVIAASPLWAAAEQDDVLAIIKEAVGQYEQGDYAGAANNLDYAAQLVRQKKGEAIKSYLPEPLPGWEAEEAVAQAMGSAVFGGGISVSRAYRRDSASITIDIVTDSPVMQSLVMMINNPMVAGASGGTLTMVNGQRAIVQFSDETGNGDISIVVANRFMVTVKGSNVSKAEMMAYAEAIDYGKMAGN